MPDLLFNTGCQIRTEEQVHRPSTRHKSGSMVSFLKTVLVTIISKCQSCWRTDDIADRKNIT